MLGSHPLDPLQLLDVRADLEHRPGLDVAGQLRVGDLVVVRAPDRGALRGVDPEQEVGVSEPAPVEEGGLEDDLGAGCHGRDGFLGLPPDPRPAFLLVVALDRHHPALEPAQRVEVAGLVGESTLPDDVELPVVADRPLELAVQHRRLERGEVLAGQVADEIGGTEDGRAVDQLHRCVTNPRIGSSLATGVTARLSRARVSHRRRRTGWESGLGRARGRRPSRSRSRR